VSSRIRRGRRLHYLKREDLLRNRSGPFAYVACGSSYRLAYCTLKVEETTCLACIDKLALEAEHAIKRSICHMSARDGNALCGTPWTEVSAWTTQDLTLVTCPLCDQILRYS